jgi:hypothetical protein
MDPPCNAELLRCIAQGNKTHFDIAHIVYLMFKDDFVCQSIKNNKWYVRTAGEEGSSWLLDENARSLRIKLSVDVVKMFCSVSAYFAQKACFAEDETERERLANISKRVLVVTHGLKDHAFKNAVVKECCDLFFIRDFVLQDT